MKTNIFSYTALKNYVENGTTYRIDVKIQQNNSMLHTEKRCKHYILHRETVRFGVHFMEL